MTETAKILSMLDNISRTSFAAEKEICDKLIKYLEDIGEYQADAEKIASKYVIESRKSGKKGLESFFAEYQLDTQEGIAVMSLAEALLRIPDAENANDLIHEKLNNANWQKHFGKSSSALVNTSTLGLQIVQKLFDCGQAVSAAIDPVVREAVKQSMRQIGKHFVIGETIEAAVENSKNHPGFLFSYDMLGEGAKTEVQAARYMQHYLQAIDALKNCFGEDDPLYSRPSISIKISALYPRYELAKREDIYQHLVPRIESLVQQAMEVGVMITIDAEEAARLDISLEIFAEIISKAEYRDYPALGLAVQAYQKRAFDVIDFIIELANQTNKRIPVRLVKGAYWDSEIKRAQVLGLDAYPVFTNKSHTDISYLACAKKMLENNDYIYPQFATHNAMTIGYIEAMAADKEYEFQLLEGMGGGLYEQIVKNRACRIYAPVGPYKELLPYLIRRLLENAANNSFVRKLADENIPLNELLNSPFNEIDEECKSINLPKNIFSDRKNSKGLDLDNNYKLKLFMSEFSKADKDEYICKPFLPGYLVNGEKKYCFSPANKNLNIGVVEQADEEIANSAIGVAKDMFKVWKNISVEKRAQILEKAADILESRQISAMKLCILEAGKTLSDARDEVREAVDFLRYYASQARKIMADDLQLTSPTGEKNSLSLNGRGVFFCISPWNFPLAIFTGQISAALVTGNTVIAKPANDTSLIAYFMVEIFQEAGLPDGTLTLLPGSGRLIGNILLKSPDINGVCFTGSTETAWHINRTLAARDSAIAPLIAETGGQNAMIVDSSALPEQIVTDVINSAFGSAGQRCSALRVLYLQEDIADEVIEMLTGAVEMLKIGDPADPATDIGPVISENAQKILYEHIDKMHADFKFICRGQIDDDISKKGWFVAPHIFEINHISDLKEEVFGPVLHIRRFILSELDNVIEEINDTGFGLTLGIHTRIEGRAEYIKNNVNVGNIYLNRSMTGAVVGVQPFGGEGLSGTGPKAGGPNYLYRFITEHTYTVNMSAFGG
ncbi:bifunctional proline dehydrogenase/L-glutamate gamma-semialdehyde dehydrogenase PutA, partial [Rickettsiales bacterium]|nr:bifunctional proline dehydrogenase/L-glutamate gamma-semialdehyde dehydrogenase PutA [Rickettsiales bacterium]